MRRGKAGYAVDPRGRRTEKPDDPPETERPHGQPIGVGSPIRLSPVGAGSTRPGRSPRGRRERLAGSPVIVCPCREDVPQQRSMATQGDGMPIREPRLIVDPRMLAP
jgi:hypothetical protein